MKPAMASASRRRTTFVLSCVLFAAVLTLAAAAWAQSEKSGSWPTTKWVVMNEKPQGASDFGPAFVDRHIPFGERAELAEKHRKMLEAASIWYRSLGFPAPHQLTEDKDLDVDPGEAYRALLNEDPEYIGSWHDSDGAMILTSHPDFLPADTPMWELMKGSAVHELYHGIQDTMSPQWSQADPGPKNPECRDDTNLAWLSEGTAAMVQIRWLEQTEGVSWGHPYKGSNRATWLRVFDQSLHRGALPLEHQVSKDRIQASGTEEPSWACDYGTWYFWYAIGDMIGRNDREKVAYTRHLFDSPRSFDNSGIGAVDLGLKRAAEEYDAIRLYRGGLYALYPQFVAQYLTDDRFYDKLEMVELGTPGLYQTAGSTHDGGAIAPLGSRAWRFRVMLPENTSSIPYNVRFTLDAPEGTDRDDLHLIVDERVVNRPVDRTAPYADVQRTQLATPAADGAVEYLVRVANVGQIPGKTRDAEFSLRVEVDGFYGGVVSSELTAGDIDRVAGELPPGFNVRGPHPWSCGGNKNSRAIFEVRTPDEAARNLDRSMPQNEASTENWLNALEQNADKADKERGTPGASREEFAAFRRQMEEAIATAREEIKPILSAAADRARARTTTRLAATFVGQSGDGDCQVTLGAQLEGREGGAQVVAGAVDESLYPTDAAPEFSVRVHPTGLLRAMRAGTSTIHPLEPRRGNWEVCTMNEAEQQRARRLASQGSCPPVVCSAGKLMLEAAQQGRIAGTFEFDVVHWREDRYAPGCDTPLGRDKVVGHFNVSSTADGFEGKGQTDITHGMPGAPIL